mmetsp:Transcript_84792/g.169379  ORF Transcript_84792/g.169379 Transcript_84792/m.169379 type:complete len:211 (-) Transcript_84792:18-650(-)
MASSSPRSRPYETWRSSERVESSGVGPSSSGLGGVKRGSASAAACSTGERSASTQSVARIWSGVLPCKSLAIFSTALRSTTGASRNLATRRSANIPSDIAPDMVSEAMSGSSWASAGSTDVASAGAAALAWEASHMATKVDSMLLSASGTGKLLATPTSSNQPERVAHSMAAALDICTTTPSRPTRPIMTNHAHPLLGTQIKRGPTVWRE